MKSRISLWLAAFVAAVSVAGWLGERAVAEAPTPEQALSLRPIQPNVEYARPSKEEIAQSTIRAEKENGATAWIVRNGRGQILRRFADTNNDNVVDVWCYYHDGVEVYRDIDSDFNGKADQYRWLNTAGTRWGIDKNEDGKIDSWRVISPHEVAEELVYALKSRDQARFELLLLSQRELDELGLGKDRTEALANTIRAAQSGFPKLAAEQTVVTAQTRYVDFGSARPGTIPAGTDGSTKDVRVYDNASALLQTDEKHDQVFLGTLVAVGDTWKLVSLPRVGADNQEWQPGILASSSIPAAAAGGLADGPSEEMQKLLADLERLDQQSGQVPPEKQVEDRVRVLERLAEAAPERDRWEWYRQAADVLSNAVHSGNYPAGLKRLEELEKRLIDRKADENLLSHVRFQHMLAGYMHEQQQPGANVLKLQEQWLVDLEEFVGRYPKSPDAAEALLQLGMYQEFVGQTDEAQEWYGQLVKDFPNAAPTAKARGAMTRLGSVGKPIRLQGQAMQGGAVDLNATPYRGKVVLVQYWATWCQPCKADMLALKELHAKNANRGFEIIGVCLGDNPNAARQFLNENRLTWKQIYDEGGMDGRLANEMGVMTLPLMILVDARGNVVNHNIHAAQLEAELNRLLR